MGSTYVLQESCCWQANGSERSSRPLAGSRSNSWNAHILLGVNPEILGSAKLGTQECVLVKTCPLEVATDMMISLVNANEPGNHCLWELPKRDRSRATICATIL